MRRDALALALSGTFFGLLVGWIIGSQQVATPPAPPPPAAAVAAAPAATETDGSAPPPSSATPPPLDTARVADLSRQANASPTNAGVRVDLGNVYFDAQQYDKAIPWYEAALKLDPKDVNLSTDLGVAYYYTNQIDRALAQLNHSLELDPRHVKTLLNQGIVLAFGKRDLADAAKSWQRVVEIAPNSEEGRLAQQGLEGMKQAAGAAPGGAGMAGGG